MKTVGVLFAFMLFFVFRPAMCRDGGPKKCRPIGTQLALLLTNPQYNGNSVHGIVMVQFQVSEDFRICRVRVHTDDEAINVHLIRQLTGQKLVLPTSDFMQVHTIKIRFQRQTN